MAAWRAGAGAAARIAGGRARCDGRGRGGGTATEGSGFCTFDGKETTMMTAKKKALPRVTRRTETGGGVILRQRLMTTINAANKQSKQHRQVVMFLKPAGLLLGDGRRDNGNEMSMSNLDPTCSVTSLTCFS